jgi:hypothetical protein
MKISNNTETPRIPKYSEGIPRSNSGSYTVGMIATPKKDEEVTTPARTPLRSGEMTWLYVIIRGNKVPPAHPIKARASPTSGIELVRVMSPMRRNRNMDENKGTIPEMIENPYPLF